MSKKLAYIGGLSGEATQKLIEAIGLIAHDELQNTLELIRGNKPNEPQNCLHRAPAR